MTAVHIKILKTMANIKIVQKEKILILEGETEEIATQLFESISAVVNSTKSPIGWMSLSKASIFLGMTKAVLYDRIQRCESDRVAGRKSEWRFGKQYRRRGANGNWEVKIEECQN
jgi:hypothetical protein